MWISTAKTKTPDFTSNITVRKDFILSDSEVLLDLQANPAVGTWNIIKFKFKPLIDNIPVIIGENLEFDIFIDKVSNFKSNANNYYFTSITGNTYLHNFSGLLEQNLNEIITFSSSTAIPDISYSVSVAGILYFEQLNPLLQTYGLQTITSFDRLRGTSLVLNPSEYAQLSIQENTEYQFNYTINYDDISFVFGHGILIEKYDCVYIDNPYIEGATQILLYDGIYNRVRQNEANLNIQDKTFIDTPDFVYFFRKKDAD